MQDATLSMAHIVVHALVVATVAVQTASSDHLEVCALGEQHSEG